MRLMSVPVYIVLMAVVLVLLLSSTYVVNRARPNDDVAVVTMTADDQSVATWVNDVLAHGLTPSRLESLLMLVASDHAAIQPTAIVVRGTSLTLERRADERGWRGRWQGASDGTGRAVELMLSYERAERGLAIDATLVPSGASVTAEAAGYALFVKPSEAEMRKLAPRATGANVRWGSRPDAKQVFRMTAEQGDRLARLVERLPAL